MFEEISSELSRTRDVFNSHVKDAFGSSIDEEVFQHVIESLQSLESAHNEAEFKKKEIQALTFELRTIL